MSDPAWAPRSGLSNGEGDVITSISGCGNFDVRLCVGRLVDVPVWVHLFATHSPGYLWWFGRWLRVCLCCSSLLLVVPVFGASFDLLLPGHV